ncbi:SDR family NAD(P)-dependent oxidoreductase [Oceanibacterium hippocampi]|uniref:(S)-1-Phenylethanol dehydrogenase n=1 Tax=Oceanibacterium hippocampi TaxID=745714 RepID=A0A1Y5T0W8_9PROT|nr:SDR family oxidoreductase [Oceanibacterium hippocampi]SLN49490.1 (S)-1-Phenylethanol dehydrogenase [Oceanibacterium hippocampi]
MSLKDKTAIVTGAARGLGQAYAVAFAGAGANVVATDVADCADTAALVAEAGGECLALHCNVADAASTAAMAAAVRERFGGADILVNNAALYGGLKGGRFDAISEDDWNRCMAVNVTGIWNACKATVPLMREKGGGSIINIASLAATYGLAYALHYTTSKGAVIGLTRGLARELGRDNIRVNAIAPSAVLTEGTREFFGDKYEKALGAIAGNQTLQKNLTTEDLVGTVLYLAGPGSAFVTGQTIAVDGGTVML